MSGSTVGAISSDPLRILIVDDCADTTESLALLIRMWGYQARVAGDAAEALRLAADYRPNVILLDVGMPAVSGWDLAPQLRQLPGLHGVLIVVVSGYDRPDDFRRSYQASCNLHLTKPVDPVRLQQLLAAYQKEKSRHDP
jgi:CheY-like chemotaxis protein